MRGYLWAMISVILVTAAQLIMKWAMIHLPKITDLSLLFGAFLPITLPALALFAGLFFYLISVFCWAKSLRWIPLNRAYPLLSLSYVFVWLVALFIPGFNEVFGIVNLVGILFILSGLWLICSVKSK